MHFLYIIYSQQADEYFIGETHNVPERIELHNSYRRIKTITRRPFDWKQKLIFKCTSRKEAVYLKKHLKKMKSRELVEKIIVKPQILENILSTR